MNVRRPNVSLTDPPKRIRPARGEQQRDRDWLAAGLPIPDHGHERHNAGAGADQEHWFVGRPRPEKVSAKRPAKFDRVAYLGDVVEERGDLAVQEAADCAQRLHCHAQLLDRLAIPRWSSWRSSETFDFTAGQHVDVRGKASGCGSIGWRRLATGVRVVVMRPLGASRAACPGGGLRPTSREAARP